MSNITSLDALADPTRRQIYELLRNRPHSVNELAEALPISQPAVSQHLKVLKAARLVQVQRFGNRRIYSLNPEGLVELRAYVEGLWEDVARAYQQAAEKIAQEEKDDE